MVPLQKQKSRRIILRCTDIYLRERISKYELGKAKSYKLNLPDLEEHLSKILEGDVGRELSLEDILSKGKFDA